MPKVVEWWLRVCVILGLGGSLVCILSYLIGWETVYEASGTVGLLSILAGWLSVRAVRHFRPEWLVKDGKGG